MKTIRKSIYPALVGIGLACSVLSPTAQAQLSPPPDGGYPNQNTAEGDDALFSLTSGAENTAIGFQALYSNSDVVHNTAVGFQALANNGQSDNSGVGWHALFNNTGGYGNTAFGVDVMGFNSNGSFNTAAGFTALLHNDADYNTAYGAEALYSNTIGTDNTAMGFDALYSNTTGVFNTATGHFALVSNTTGDFNTASGQGALGQNGTGGANTADGQGALGSNTEGSWNTATGTDTMVFNTAGWLNTAIGANALHKSTTGTLNVALGWAAGDRTTGNNNITIGNIGTAGESDTIRIGAPATVIDEFGVTHLAHKAIYVGGIIGKTTPRGVPVFINANGQLGTSTSSARFKDEIKPMNKSSDTILALKPVTFHYKKEVDPDAVPQFGLVAEDVEKVNPDLVVRDADGKVYSVRYEAVNAMLLNEFLKAHRRIEEQDKRINQLTTRLNEQAALIQKVNDKVEFNKPTPQTVLNNQ